MNRPWKWCRSLSRSLFRPNFDPIESEKWALKRLTEELRMMSIKLVTQGHRKKEMLFAWGWGPSLSKLFCEWLRKKFGSIRLRWLESLFTLDYSNTFLANFLSILGQLEPILGQFWTNFTPLFTHFWPFFDLFGSIIIILGSFWEQF